MATYYVAKFGSDSNNGGPATPWLTINHAALKAKAGDTVEIETGTYNEFVYDVDNSGNIENPITFENYAKQNVIIDGTGLIDSNNEYGLLYIYGSYINWQGITIQNGPSRGIYIIDSSYINLTNMIAQGNFESGIAITASNIIIDTCIIYNNGTDNGEENTIEASNQIEIKNCNIYGNTTAGGIDIKNGCYNIFIHNNFIHDIASGDSGIYCDNQGKNQNSINIYANLIYNVGNAIGVADEVGSSLLNASIYNNIIFNNVYGFHSPNYNFSKTVNIINNTFYNNLISIDWDDPAQYQINCVVRNNIMVQNSGYVMLNWVSASGITTDHNLFYDTTGTYNTNYGTNYIKGNPLFSNPTTDFSLQANSPAIGAGYSLGAPLNDYAGNIRSTTPCIGAYEYVPTGFTHGTTHTASFNTTVIPANQSCQIELWLGPNSTTKSATSGLQSFTSTGIVQNLNLQIIMPAAGTYNVYIDLYMGGIKFLSFVGTNTMQVT